MIVCYFEQPASTDPSQREHELFSCDRIRRADGRVMVAWDVSAFATLVHNLAIAGALCAAFRAGDNHGFHMGSDESQCTCQWAPNACGEAYRGSTRCEQDEVYEADERNEYDCPHCDYGCSACDLSLGGVE